MILAAGFGKRLRPLTEKIPKALIPIGGVPILEIVIRRLVAAGVSSIVVNVHHWASQVEEFIKSRDFGVPIEVSFEEEILETGGGLKKVEYFLKDEGPFFLHNADVLSALDLKAFYGFHLNARALASVSVRRRPNSRALLFTPRGELCGIERESQKIWARDPVLNAEALAFDGIHVISPGIFPKLKEIGRFSIIESYLRLAREGEKISAFRSDFSNWIDIGSLENLEKARMMNFTGGPKV